MKKRKKYNIILIFVCTIAIIMFLTSITGAIQFYKTPTGSMEPSLSVGTKFVVTNLKKAKRNDIIVFTRLTTEADGFTEPGKKLFFTSRLIAFGGETVQLKNGVAYVNDQLIDDTTTLQFAYITNETDIPALIKKLNLNDNDQTKIQLLGNGKAFAMLSFKEYEIAKQVASLNKSTADFNTNYKLYGDDSLKKWTIDNYGPLKIPSNSYFFLGDNRQASSDSRFNGPIPEENLKGVYLFSY